MITKFDKDEWLANGVTEHFIGLLRLNLRSLEQDLNDIIIGTDVTDIKEKLDVIIEMKGRIHQLEEILEIHDFLTLEEKEDD